MTHLLKSLYTLFAVLTMFSSSLLAQKKTTFFADAQLKKRVLEEKANYKLEENRSTDSIVFELTSLKKNCLMRIEKYDTNFVPIGEWQVFDFNCQRSEILNFSSLRYVGSEEWMEHVKSNNADFVLEEVVMPEFPEGDVALFNYLGKETNYPSVAVDNGSEGMVYVSFIIDSDGSIFDVVVLRGVDPYIDLEAVRVVKEMPNWKPATKNGEPIRVNYNLPISFRLR